MAFLASNDPFNINAALCEGNSGQEFQRLLVRKVEQHQALKDIR